MFPSKTTHLNPMAVWQQIHGTCGNKTQKDTKQILLKVVTIGKRIKSVYMRARASVTLAAHRKPGRVLIPVKSVIEMGCRKVGIIASNAVQC